LTDGHFVHTIKLPMNALTQEEIKAINGLRGLFPSSINVSIHRTESGEFVARINTFKGFMTEGKTFSELIEMVNDAVKTYFEIPEKFISYMPSYVPSIEVAQELDVFPVKKSEQTIVLPLAAREGAAR
jgi:predicted RNase H-like HicB family nuclease